MVIESPKTSKPEKIPVVDYKEWQKYLDNGCKVQLFQYHDSDILKIKDLSLILVKKSGGRVEKYGIPDE